ncbi:MAG: outer membrane protein assembly factor BamD [Candidatus Aminicenantaceae bacterium]
MNNTKKKLTLVLILSVLCFLVDSGCRGKKPEISPEASTSDESLFREGEKYVKKDPERARLYFRQVIDTYPRSIYAQQAKLAIADSYFQKADEGNMIIAASEYREFISLFPISPSAPYAQHQISMTFYKKIHKPGRDQSKTQRALEEFKKVVTNYPLSNEAKSAQEKIADCEDRLAAHSLHIGVHYYRVKAYKAAVKRLLEIVANYPNFSEMNRVYYYMGNSYLKARMTDQSIPYFTKLISDFPESKFAKKAQKRLKEIEKQIPKKKK